MIRDLRYAGVYCIYENEKIIYVGSAGLSHTLRYRIGDLFVYNENSKKSKFHHTLTYKLIYDKDLRRYANIDQVRDFYFKDCRFKVIITDSDAETHALEYLLIMLFKPPFNNETKNQYKQ
jgi:excinuclease UvrABC nuclease subunit